MVLFQPAELFAMRTIRHQAHHVTPLCPANQFADAVEQRVGAFEFANRFRRGLNNGSVQRFNFWQGAICRWSEMDLNVTATDVKKLRRPRLNTVRRLDELA